MGWMFPRGLRPRAMLWVCSAYLKFAAPREGCRGKQFAQAEIQNAFADLLIQHPGGMQAYSPGSKTPGTIRTQHTHDPIGVASLLIQNPLGYAVERLAGRRWVIPRRPFVAPVFGKMLHYYLEKMQVIATLQRRIYFPVKQIYASDEKD